jgi:hypothetical protein
MGTPVNNEGGAYLTVIGHSITLDEILEANYVGDCLLGEPDFILVARYSAFLSDLQTPPIARHDERVASLGDLGREPLVTTKVKRRLVVQQKDISKVKILALLRLEGKDNLGVALLQHFHSLLEMTCPFRGQR